MQRKQRFLSGLPYKHSDVVFAGRTYHSVRFPKIWPKCIVLQAGLVAHLPVKDFYIQSWQEPVVRVYDCNGNWTDVEGTAPILHVKDGGKVKLHSFSVHIPCCRT